MKKVILMVAAMVTAQAFAQDGIRLGLPGYAGTGCPAGSASATLSPDAKELSILFDSYVVEAGGTTRKAFDRKNCTVAIPVHLPQGFSLSILAIDYRGYNNLPAGASSEFTAEYFFAGSQGPSYRKAFYGPLDDDYTFSNNLLASAIVWSPCGADVNLRSNSAIRVTTNNQRQQAMATVDSADISAALIYKLQWRRCF